MWILECEGDVLKGKRIWLRPGSKHLFGRTRPSPEVTENHAIVISNKSVSRQHLLITVKNVDIDNGSKLDSRAELCLTDKSKMGTIVDGVKIQNRSVVLADDQHDFQLGNFEQKFSIHWFPVVLTPASTLKRSQDSLKSFEKQLEEIDIKWSLDYVEGLTTHVVASKRNLAKCLQGLVGGRYIVTDAYLDAIQRVTSFTSDGDSLLESDFDGQWPDPLLYVPSPGKEPNPCSEFAFIPDTGRNRVFAGYSFVFVNETQFEQLADVVTGGGGQALLFQLAPGPALMEDFKSFVKDINVEKLVVVRFSRGPDTEQSKVECLRAIELFLGQRAMEQNEFLGAILCQNPSQLNRKLAEDIVIESGVEFSSRSSQVSELEQRNGNRNVPSPQQPMDKSNPLPSHNKQTPRALYRSKFSGFNDFDPYQVAEDDYSVNENTDTPKIATDVPQGTAATVGFEDGVPEVVPPELRKKSISTRGCSKRFRDEELDTGSEELIETLMPTNVALKKRKKTTAEGLRSEVQKAASHKSAAAEAAENLHRARQRADVEVDVGVITSARRAEEEKRAQDERENLREAMQRMEVDGTNIIAPIEEWDVKLRKTPSKADALQATAVHQQDVRWDERWNLRKNFKTFHKARRGEQHERPYALRRTTIGLEVVKRVNHSNYEHDWLEQASELTSSRERDFFGSGPSDALSISLRTDTTQNDLSATVDRAFSQGRSERNTSNSLYSQKQGQQINREAELGLGDSAKDRSRDMPEMITNAGNVRTTSDQRLNDSSQLIDQSRKQGATADGLSAKDRRGVKRAIESLYEIAPQAKRRMSTARRSTACDDDDEEEDLKFRFRRK